MMKKIILCLICQLILVNFCFSAEKVIILTSVIPPYVNNTDSGLATEIIKDLFQKSGIDYSIRIRPFKRALKEAKLHNNSCVVPLQRSQERETQFKWVGPVIITQTGLYSNSSDNIKIQVFHDAFQNKILVLRGSGDEEYLKGFGILTDPGSSEELNARKLKARRSRLWAADTMIAPYYASRVGAKIKLQTIIITTMRYLAFNKGIADSTIDKLNNELDLMRKKGSLEKIYEKYARKLNIKDVHQFIF